MYPFRGTSGTEYTRVGPGYSAPQEALELPDLAAGHCKTYHLLEPIGRLPSEGEFYANDDPALPRGGNSDVGWGCSGHRGHPGLNTARHRAHSPMRLS